MCEFWKEERTILRFYSDFSHKGRANRNDFKILTSSNKIQSISLSGHPQPNALKNGLTAFAENNFNWFFQSVAT